MGLKVDFIDPEAYKYDNLTLCGKQVMLDRDLVELYQVETK